MTSAKPHLTSTGASRPDSTSCSKNTASRTTTRSDGATTEPTRLHDTERERGNYWRHRALSNEQQILELEDELDRCVEALWECMKAAGADTSYAAGHRHAYALGKAGQPTLPVAAIQAVQELRND